MKNDTFGVMKDIFVHLLRLDLVPVLVLGVHGHELEQHQVEDGGDDGEAEHDEEEGEGDIPEEKDDGGLGDAKYDHGCAAGADFVTGLCGRDGDIDEYEGD